MASVPSDPVPPVRPASVPTEAGLSGHEIPPIKHSDPSMVKIIQKKPRKTLIFQKKNAPPITNLIAKDKFDKSIIYACAENAEK